MAAELQTTVITIVSFGFDTKSGGSFLKDSRDSKGIHIVDLRQSLVKDPATSIGHGEDGTHLQTQRVVFGQGRFLEVMKGLVESVVTDRHTVIGLGCRQGIHRSDTCARTLECCLNAVLHEDGSRAFNAKQFSMSASYGWLQILSTKPFATTFEP